MAGACRTIRISPNLLSADCHTPLYPERPSCTNNGYYTVCHPYSERTWGTKRDRYNLKTHWRSVDEPLPIKNDWVLRVQDHYGSGAIPVQDNFVIPPHLINRPRKEKRLHMLNDEICPPPEKFIIDKKTVRTLGIPETTDDPFGRKVYGQLFPVHDKNRIDPDSKEFVLSDAVRSGLDELEHRYYSLHDRLDPFEKRFNLSCKLNEFQRAKATRECLRAQVDQRVHELQTRARIHTRSVAVDPEERASTGPRPTEPCGFSRYKGTDFMQRLMKEGNAEPKECPSSPPPFQVRPEVDYKGNYCLQESPFASEGKNNKEIYGRGKDSEESCFNDTVTDRENKHIPQRQERGHGRLVAGQDAVFGKSPYSVGFDCGMKEMNSPETSEGIPDSVSDSHHKFSQKTEREYLESADKKYDINNNEVKSTEDADDCIQHSTKSASKSGKHRVHFSDEDAMYKVFEDRRQRAGAESILEDRLGRLGRPEEDIAERELERMMYMHRRGQITSRLTKAKAVCDVMSPHKKSTPCHPYWTSRNENRDPTLLKPASEKIFPEEEQLELDEKEQDLPQDPDRDIKKLLGYGLKCPYPPVRPPEVCPKPLRPEYPKLPCPPPGQPNTNVPAQVLPMTAEQISRELHPRALYNPWIHEQKPLYQPSHYKMMLRKSFQEMTKDCPVPDLRENKRNLRKNYFYGGYHSSFFR